MHLLLLCTLCTNLITSPPQSNLGRAHHSRTTTQHSPTGYNGTHQIHPKTAPSPQRSSNTPIFRPTPLTTLNGIRIRSAVLPQYTIRTDRPTHRPTDGIGDRSTPLVLTLAILIESDALIIHTMILYTVPSGKRRE